MCCKGEDGRLIEESARHAPNTMLTAALLRCISFDVR